MSAAMPLDKSRVEIKLGDYGVAPATALADASVLPRVREYRRRSSSRMQPLDRDDVLRKIPAAEYHVSRKVDGEFAVLVFRGGEAFTINPGGTVRVGMPWLEEAARLLSGAKLKEALVAGELYVARDDRRPRVHDVTSIARQPRSPDDLGRLRFAVFDILSLDGDASPRPFAATWKTIEKCFGKGQAVHPVEAKMTADVAGIERLFEQWVEKEGAEGLVVRDDTAGMFKIKPRHTLDAAVIGFTESLGDRQGMLHDMLLAVMRPEGTLQVLSRVGGGFADDQRRALLCDLKDMVVESEYAEVNADHVAYQMVQPEWVVEISCLDLISQTTRGGTVDRMVLDYRVNGSQRYDVVTRLPLASVISPQFIRRREDKSVVPQDVRIAQVTDLVEVPWVDRDSRQMTLPASELLRREVFSKDLKGQTMVRKFLLWKSNKESGSDEFPAYVAHYTDFSPNRKDALAREIRVSSSREQIESLFEGLQEANIKSGWQRCAAGSVPLAAAVDSSSAGALRKEMGSDEAAIAKGEPATAGAGGPAGDAAVGDMAPSARKKRTTRKKTG
ncbi:MAG TPA: hypothetical protein VMV69_25020 [Pirellulales bacterium]|nr:hypothetical protein [Pirellulales bacterium]